MNSLLRTVAITVVLLCFNDKLVHGQEEEPVYTPTFNTVGHVRYRYYDSYDGTTQCVGNAYREYDAVTNRCIPGGGQFEGAIMFTCVNGNNAADYIRFYDENCQFVRPSGPFVQPNSPINGCFKNCSNDEPSAPVTSLPSMQVVGWYSDDDCSDSSYLFSYSSPIDECFYRAYTETSYAAICSADGTEGFWSVYDDRNCQERPAAQVFNYSTQCTPDPNYSFLNTTIYSKLLQCGNPTPSSWSPTPTTTTVAPTSGSTTPAVVTSTTRSPVRASVFTVNTVPSYHAGDSVTIEFTGRGSSNDLQICLVRLASLVNYYCDVVVSSNAVLAYDSGSIEYVLPSDLPVGKYSLVAGFNLIDSDDWQEFAYELNAFKIIPKAASDAATFIHANKADNTNHAAKRLTKSFPTFFPVEAETGVDAMKEGKEKVQKFPTFFPAENKAKKFPTFFPAAEKKHEKKVDNFPTFFPADKKVENFPTFFAAAVKQSDNAETFPTFFAAAEKQAEIAASFPTFFPAEKKAEKFPTFFPVAQGKEKKPEKFPTFFPAQKKADKFPTFFPRAEKKQE